LVEAKSWEWYKNLLLTPTRINKGKAFTKQFPQTLDQAQNIYGVPSEYIASILGVETMYGERKGQFLVPEALATIGFYYPKRSKFFLYELDSLLQLEKNTHINIFSLKGSYAGAFGMGQFMPDSYQDYAISHKNKAPDLMHSFDDNILSIANFLSKKGKWQKDQPCLKPIFNSQPNPVAAQLMKNQHTRWLGKNDPKFKAFYPEGTMENVTGVLVVRETKDSYSTWLTYPNYHAIKTYNISDMYALLVHLLAEEVHG
jgi:membrane-bound lytic murein transglycosylase B